MHSECKYRFRFNINKMELPDCKICHTPFDLYEHMPIILPTCGHTYCKRCLERSLRSSMTHVITCPEDNKVG